jgi:exoribonuclease R
MTLYKIHVHDRSYTDWSFYDILNYQVNNLNVVPIEHKLFSNDVFSVDNDGNVKIEHSSVRIVCSIPGVLVLKNNKTYGRKNGKLLYKCVPDDMRLPSFLIPYEIKHVGFSKVFLNMYVTFSYTEWNDKHPHGILNQVIGDVDVLDNFYEYQLYCKSLNASIQKFTKDTSKALKTKSHDAFIENISKKYSSIEDRTNQSEWKIFTIDPPTSADYDDAFSIQDLGDGKHKLSIYIANVTIWMDVLNLWDSFSKRISTIYLPDRKRPMLPTILSDCLCSLQQNNTRIAFVMDIIIEEDEIKSIEYKNCTIKVIKNYAYEEPKLLENPEYNYLFDVTKRLSKKFRYLSNVKNSHDVVCYLMIFMNYHCATELLKHKNGIFRSTIMKKDVSIPDNVPEDVSKHIKIWNSSSGQYLDGSDVEVNTRHDLLEMDAYIHITSPIRRLVDLLNIIKFQQNNDMVTLSENASKFYDKWINELDYINVTMRAIRKVQCDCTLLDLCTNNPEVMEKIYDGYPFDKIVRNDGLYQYIVYLPDLKLSSRITSRENIENYTRCNFKMYLFLDEDTFKKKIRLQMQP